MIDWDRVRTLRQEVGPEDFDEVLELFFSEVEAVIDRLPQLHDAKALEQDLHYLKGGAMNLGFSALSDRCILGEDRAGNGEVESVQVEDIVSVYMNSKQRFIDDYPQQM